MTATARGLADEARGTGVPQGSGSRLVVSDVAHPLEAMFAACIIHRVTFATHLHFNLELWPSGDADGRGVCCTAHRGMWRSGGAMWIRSRCGATCLTCVPFAYRRAYRVVRLRQPGRVYTQRCARPLPRLYTQTGRDALAKWSARSRDASRHRHRNLLAYVLYPVSSPFLRRQPTVPFCFLGRRTRPEGSLPINSQLQHKPFLPFHSLSQTALCIVMQEIATQPVHRAKG